ncbi:DUF6167 family protein [Streptomyces sp. H27-D2]|uniref:DUF6167 family protein n=1 Tax=Streptomyces sp. H27-D2 TaxID=3046304 RepID=UPI002DB80BD0|nr:DUF6167 family protein [Streptomyces sp. H27-D2]MEC4015564.1 DUF6167 family protein [Streptomyces sp. H27-D2]
MFRRTFWFTAGAAAGVYATAKVNRKLRQLTPESLAATAADKALETGRRVKDFALDVRSGMRRREGELNEALGIEASLDPYSDEYSDTALPTQRHRAAIDQKHPYNRNEDH